MLSRLGPIFLSLITNRFEGIISATLFAIAQEILKKSRQTLLIIMVSFIFSMLLTAGVIISILEAAAQYDARGTIFFTALLSGSLTLIVVSFLVLTALFWPRQPTATSPQTPALVGHTAHPLEEILMAVVAEGIQYFKNKSQETTKAPSSSYSQA